MERMTFVEEEIPIDEAAAAAPIVAPDLAEYFTRLALSALIESGHNPRTHFDPAKLADLAESIRQKGVVEPLVVRPLRPMAGIDEECFEIIAGARRFRAAKLAGVADVPCVVRTYSDEDVLELTIIENIQRDDLDPLEEARGYRALIDANPARYSAAYIAARIGKSEKYVWDRMKLLDLVPYAQELLEAGRIQAGHAILLARLKPEDQARALDHQKGGLFVAESRLWNPREDEADASVDPETGDERAAAGWSGLKAVTVRELEKWIAEHVRFDPVHAANAAPLDFGPVAAEVDRALAQPGRGKKVIAITYDHVVKEDARDSGTRTFTPGSWKRADGREASEGCASAVLGVVAVGPEYGTAFEVCIDKACDVHWQAERRTAERAAKKRTQSATSREDADAARREQDEARAREEAQRTAWKAATPAIVEAMAVAIMRAKPMDLAGLVLGQMDLYHGDGYLKAAIARLKTPKSPDAVLRVGALAALAARAGLWQAPRDFPKLARSFGVDVASILKGEAPPPVHTSAVAKARPATRSAKRPAGKARRRR